MSDTELAPPDTEEPEDPPPSATVTVHMLTGSPIEYTAPEPEAREFARALRRSLDSGRSIAVDLDSRTNVTLSPRYVVSINLEVHTS